MSAAPNPNNMPAITAAEEYLAFDNASPIKHEFINGEIVAMVGSNENHNIISMNIAASLHSQLRDRPCKVYHADMRVNASPKGDYSYPDVAAVCGDAEFLEAKRLTLLNPIVIVEVLSDSTRGYDREEKAQAYRTLPGLQAYLLIAQDAPYIEYYRRTDEGWLLQDIIGLAASVELHALGCTLAMADVCAKVEFEEDDAPPADDDALPTPPTT